MGDLRCFWRRVGWGVRDLGLHAGRVDVLEVAGGELGRKLLLLEAVVVVVLHADAGVK